MLLFGAILFVVGVVLLIAPIPLPNVDAVGWICVAAGLILVVIGALLASDIGDSSHAALFGGLPTLWRRRKRQSIEPGLAQCLAGQVAIGVADPDPMGARMSLIAIGLMLGNASDDAVVQETLGMQLEIERSDGSILLRRVG